MQQTAAASIAAAARRIPGCTAAREARGEGHEWVATSKWAATQGSDGVTRTHHACPYCLATRTESWRLSGQVQTEYDRYPNHAPALPDRLLEACEERGVDIVGAAALKERYRPSTPQEREVCVF